MVSTISTRKYNNGLPGSHLLVSFVSPLSAFCCTIVDYASHLDSMHNNQNPEQSPYDNLPAAVAVREVGGMGAYWTCSTPEQRPEIEGLIFFPTKSGKICTPRPRLSFTPLIRHLTIPFVKNSSKTLSVKRAMAENLWACP